MSKMNKIHLYLVSTQAVRKKFDMLYVYLADGSWFEYKLDEIKVSLVDEWVEVERVDKSAMESFMSHNIMRMKFTKGNMKAVSNEHKAPDLQPVA